MSLSICSYTCKKCGSCCRSLFRNTLYADLDRGDGTCIHFQESNNLCTIYEERPMICRIDEMYERFFKRRFSKQEYYELNQNACKKLRSNQR
ncbi:MAG: YkgJ family cysteine cluster protein [Thermotaleaceae bacterium]